MDAYHADFRTTSCYAAKYETWGMLKHLFSYLVDEGVQTGQAGTDTGPVPLGP